MVEDLRTYLWGSGNPLLQPILVLPKNVCIPWIIKKGPAGCSGVPIVAELFHNEGRDVRKAETEITFKNKTCLLEGEVHLHGQEAHFIGDVLIVQSLAVAISTNRRFGNEVGVHVHGIQSKTAQATNRAFAIIQKPTRTQLPKGGVNVVVVSRIHLKMGIGKSDKLAAVDQLAQKPTTASFQTPATATPSATKSGTEGDNGARTPPFGV